MLTNRTREACLAAALGACLWSGCSSSKPRVEPQPQPIGTSVTAGEKLYDKYCKLCHGEDGTGYAADFANALTNQDFLATATDPFLFTAIDQGRPGTAMAAYGDAHGGPLTSGDIRLIMTYLRSFQKEEDKRFHDVVVEGDADAAKPMFAERCAKCHGEEGQGKTALSLANPMFLATASDGYIRYAIENGRRGTPMPAFGEDLSNSDIDNLTRLIRSWARTATSSPGGEVPPSFENVVVNPDGPAPELTLREGRYAPAAQVKEQLEKGARMIFLDARPTSDWLKSHIPGALPFPYYDAEKMIASLPKDGTWIISYCACPHAASGKVMDALRARGFEHTAVIDEGILVWTARGYPLTFGATP
jgi:mono/diheme cytochrome c family protein/rhodanese-related sulfurtransferase